MVDYRQTIGLPIHEVGKVVLFTKMYAEILSSLTNYIIKKGKNKWHIQ